MTYETQKRDGEIAFNRVEKRREALMKKIIAVRNKEEAFTMASILLVI